MQESIPKCLLLPLDGRDESLKPIIDYLRRLYPVPDHLQIILCHFVTPLAPVYREKAHSPEMIKRKTELLQARQQEALSILEQARQALLAAGFTAEQVQLHIQERASSMAHHACRLADIKKVDAVLMQKRSTSRLEGFFKGDPTDAVLHHCTFSPLWFIDGPPDLTRAAICVTNEAAALRAADHAAFMFAGTTTRITLLHVTRSVSQALLTPAFEPSAALLEWWRTPEGKALQPFMTECCTLLEKEGIAEERVQVAVIPGRSKGKGTASEILQYCREQGVGTVVLGHVSSDGTWNFLKGSVTKDILADFRKMAVWVVQ